MSSNYAEDYISNRLRIYIFQLVFAFGGKNYWNHEGDLCATRYMSGGYFYMDRLLAENIALPAGGLHEVDIYLAMIDTQQLQRLATHVPTYFMPNS